MGTWHFWPHLTVKNFLAIGQRSSTNSEIRITGTLRFRTFCSCDSYQSQDKVRSRFPTEGSVVDSCKHVTHCPARACFFSGCITPLQEPLEINWTALTKFPNNVGNIVAPTAIDLQLERWRSTVKDPSINMTECKISSIFRGLAEWLVSTLEISEVS